MWNKPEIEFLKQIPDLYSTENKPLGEKTIYLKFFIGSATWYIAEISHEDYSTMFGYADLGDSDCAEWGYISLSELEHLKLSFMEVDRDLHWTPKKFKEIPGVKILV